MYKPMSQGIINYRKNNIHKYKRNLLYTTFQTGAITGEYLAGWQFLLTDMSNYNEFTSLYDYYKIIGVKLRIIHRAINMSMLEVSNSASKVGFPYMYYVIDRDDISTPASVNEIRECSRAKQFSYTADKRVCRIYLKPNLTNQINTQSGTGQALNYNGWVDCADTTARYFGVKVAVLTPFSLSVPSVAYFDVEATYYLAMKDPR